MKLRTGFVSNSSSASFVIDTKLTVGEFVEFLKKHQIDINRDNIGKNFYGFASVGGWTSMWNGEEDMGEPYVLLLENLKKEFGEDSCQITVQNDY